MSFPTAIATCFAKFVTFSGRAPRSEYWWFYLFSLICAVAGLIVDGAVLGMSLIDEDGDFTGGPVFWLVVLALGLPHLSVSIRRLHDIDSSGYWIWIQLIPFVGPLIFLMWMCTSGTDGENDYGPEFADTSVAEVFE